MKIIDVGRPVPGYQKKYFVSHNGHVSRRMPDGTIMPVPPRIDRAGYLTVRLFLEGTSRTFFVHRLVATLFVSNPDKRRIVNHKNGRKKDNRAVNLEWVTHAENIRHAYKLGLLTGPGKIAVIDRCNGRKFPSVKAAADFHQIPYSTCKNYLNGRYKNPTCLQYAE